MLGIYGGNHIPSSISLIYVGITFILLLTLYRKNKRICKFLALTSLIAVGAFLINFRLYPTLAPHHIVNIIEEKEVELVGTIYRPPQRNGEKIVLYIVTGGIFKGEHFTPVTGKVRITISHISGKDIIEVHKRIRNFGFFMYIKQGVSTANV